MSSNATAEQAIGMTPPSGAGRQQAEQALAGLLETGDEADRCHACKALGTMGSHAQVPRLVARLRDEDVDVCVDAAEAIGKLGDRSVVPALLESLHNDPDGEVKTAVLEALGRLGGSEACAALLAVAARRPEAMAFDDTDSWDPWWDMQLTAVEALGRMGVERAAPVLDGILDDEDGQDIDPAVLKSLALIGPDGERRLLRRLTQGDARSRRRAATALGHARSPSAIKRLAGALLDKAPEVRVAVVEALGNARAMPYLPAIALMHRDADPGVRAAAARVAADLAVTADVGALPLKELSALAADPMPEVQRVALAALARAPVLPETLREPLESALLARDELSAMAACQVLGRFADETACSQLLGVLADTERATRVRCAAARAVGTAGVCGEALLNGLTRAVGDNDQSVRLAALSALMDLAAGWQNPGQGDAGIPDTTPSSPHAVVLAALAGTLLRPEVPVETRPTPDQEHVPRGTSVEGASSASDSERTSAAQALDREPRSTLESIAVHNAEVALGILDAQAAEDDAQPAERAAEDDPELEQYLDIVEANERTAQWLFARDTAPVPADVRRLAARVVGGAAFAGAFPVLIECLHDDDAELRKEAAASMALIAAATDLESAQAALAPLEAACNDPDRNIRAAAARALGALGEITCVPTLRMLLGDGDPAVRIQAVQALGALAATGRALADDDPSYGDPLADLTSLLTDQVPGVRKAALAALASLFATGSISLDAAGRAAVVEQVLAAGFAGNGSQARDAARALRHLDPEAAARRAITSLGSLPSSAERRVAIQILQELYDS